MKRIFVNCHENVARICKVIAKITLLIAKKFNSKFIERSITIREEKFAQSQTFNDSSACKAMSFSWRVFRSLLRGITNVLMYLVILWKNKAISFL